MSVNIVLLVGIVGSDPEVRYLEGETTVANLSLATNESYVDKKGEKITNTEWHNVVFWNKSAEIVEKYVKKGDILHIEGTIKTKSYDDKDGVKRYKTQIISKKITMLGSKKQNTQNSCDNTKNNNQTSEDNSQAYCEDDDLPF